MSGRNPAPRRSYGGRSAEERRAERRERLLAAGLELFGTRGYAATSIERLCATASVSTRNFYEEFSGREELLTTLHRGINERAAEAVSAAYAEAADAGLPTRVERAVRAFVTATASDPRRARIAFVEVIGVSAGPGAAPPRLAHPLGGGAAGDDPRGRGTRRGRRPRPPPHDDRDHRGREQPRPPLVGPRPGRPPGRHHRRTHPPDPRGVDPGGRPPGTPVTSRSILTPRYG
ncbi:TetR/AcrR family transcriptional regulator [Actinomadura madurae]|uniref:TetR/AcrR family transcriptional regulator n=1 Tax=Actinomadura madurae TaxID=1993 RepID=UPI0020D1FAC5|nr:TetR/AcrR family transcriptional regulator [Actinomadura madurae]MCQ0016032.1 TetR/AcrR family transcriptional regulator [Actinomadura madurae]